MLGTAHSDDPIVRCDHRRGDAVPKLRSRRSIQLAIGFVGLASLPGLGSLGCAGAAKPAEELASAEDLYRQGESELEERHLFGFLPWNDNAKSIEAFQQIIDNYPYSEYAVRAELRIGDAYFADEKYDEALSYYRDFSELHPQHEQVPYTLYRAALCHVRQAKDPVRDQTATRQALTYLDKLLARYPQAPQAKEAEGLWREMRSRLAEHEMEIAEFYMDREEFQSAADRYRGVLNKYPGLGFDAQALYSLGVCYTQMNLDDEAQKIFEVILKNYQGSDVAKAAADLIPSAN
jgi:outer membrane protein assembly factor BamD